MIMLSSRIVAQTSERRELAQALLSWAAAARLEGDLLIVHVYEDLETPAVFGLDAQWKTAEALDRHLRSDAFGILSGALKVLARPHRMVVSQPDNEHITGAIGAIKRQASDERADA